MLACLNAVLEQARRRLSLPMRLELEDIVTLQDVRDAEKALDHGRRTLDELTHSALIET
jgi:hypothetical protein